MTLAASYTLSQDATFKGRIQIAMTQAAISIGGEALGTLKYGQWVKRADLAHDVLTDPDLWVQQFTYAVCQNTDITILSTDSDLEFMVNSVWDDMAGVTGNDLQ